MYAENTTVPIERSRAEIEGYLRAHGCTMFGHSWTEKLAVIEFVAHGRAIRFSLPMPERDNYKHRIVRKRKQLATPQQQDKYWDQACRQKWRALALSIKAKFEAIAAGIVEFEEEFLSYTIDPGTRQTVWEIMKPQVAERYLNVNGAPQLLLGGPVMKAE